MRRKDSILVWVLFNAAVMSDGEGRWVVQATAIDISERRRAEEALRQSEERFRVALKDSPITVFNQDRDLRYTWIYNPQLYWQHDAIGKTDEEIIGAKKAARLIELKRHVLKDGVAVREEIVIPTTAARATLSISRLNRCLMQTGMSLELRALPWTLRGCAKWPIVCRTPGTSWRRKNPIWKAKFRLNWDLKKSLDKVRRCERY